MDVVAFELFKSRFFLLIGTVPLSSWNQLVFMNQLWFSSWAIQKGIKNWRQFTCIHMHLCTSYGDKGRSLPSRVIRTGTWSCMSYWHRPTLKMELHHGIHTFLFMIFGEYRILGVECHIFVGDRVEVCLYFLNKWSERLFSLKPCAFLVDVRRIFYSQILLN